MPSITIDVTSLSDEELFNTLKSFGEDMGPIVESTRKLYQRKLLSLMNETDETDFPVNGNAEDSSSSSIDEVENEEVYRHSPVKTTQAQEIESSTNTRQRVQTRQVNDYENVARPSASKPLYATAKNVVFDYDQHTPSPRPSLRSVISSKTTNYSSASGNLRETKALRETYGRPAEKSSSKKSSSFLMRMIVKLFIIFVIGAILYVAYQYMYGESPLEELEKIARRTLASMNKNAGDLSKEPKIKAK